MQELLKQILEVQKQIVQRLDKMDSRFDNTDERLDKLDTRFDNMDIRFDNTDKRLDKLDTRFDRMDSRFDNTDERLDNIKAQQNENTGFIQAILHNLEVANAEINNLKLTTTSKEAVAGLDAKLDILVIRQTNQEKELQLLKLAK